MLGGSLGILIGDVSGHGLPSALLMTSTQAYLRCLAQTCTTVGEIMTRVNRFVHDETDYEHFVTLLLMRYNPRTRQMVYTNAGHPSGYVFDASGLVKQELESASIPLGIKDHVDYPVPEPTTLEVGDTVVLLTDGFLEAESPDGKNAFGEQRVLNTIKAVHQLHQPANPRIPPPGHRRLHRQTPPRRRPHRRRHQNRPLKIPLTPNARMARIGLQPRSPHPSATRHNSFSRSRTHKKPNESPARPTDGISAPYSTRVACQPQSSSPPTPTRTKIPPLPAQPAYPTCGRAVRGRMMVRLDVFVRSF